MGLPPFFRVGKINTSEFRLSTSFSLIVLSPPFSFSLNYATHTKNQLRKETRIKTPMTNKLTVPIISNSLIIDP